MAAQTQKKKSKPVILALAVVAVLIAAPLGSFLFLQNGYEYRLESLDQLQPKEISKEAQELITEHAPFKGNARLIHIPGDRPKSEDELLRQIDDKIVDRTRFDILGLGKPYQNNEDHQIEYQQLGKLESISEQFVLIDTANIVRAAYSFEPGIEKSIIRHLSVVIPVPRSKKIKLNRKKEIE